MMTDFWVIFLISKIIFEKVLQCKCVLVKLFFTQNQLDLNKMTKQGVYCYCKFFESVIEELRTAHIEMCSRFL